MISTAIAVIEPARHSEHNPLRNAMQSLVLDGLSSPHTGAPTSRPSTSS